ncbi:MAG: hypothetical protein J6W68_00160 [Spirochaetia bacterium]|nr:hypothetical protein [Spirochaetia bacterium]MBP5739301.1 hypothetical protein [Spirochaetia bacterium]
MKGIGIVFLMLLLPFVCRAEADLEIKSECSSEKVIKRRVDIKGEVLEVCAVSEKEEEKEFETVSAVTPWFGFGHLKTRGLLTESMNPCGYSPTSEVFFEPARLVMDRSIEESGTYGVFVKPMDGLTCFSLGSREEQYIRGVLASLSINDFTCCLLFENSDIQEYSSPSSWYLSRPENSGGAELWNLLFNSIYEKEWFLISFTAGSCFGDYVEWGFFNRDYFTFFYSNLFELNFMFSGTTEQYLAPGGSVPASQYKYGVDAWFRPWRPLKLSGVWYTDYKRPDYKDLYYNDFARHLTLKAALYAGDFTFSASYSADTVFADTSETTEKRDYQGSIVYDSDFLRLSLSNQWYVEDERFYRDVVTAGFKLYFEYLQASFTWKRDIGEQITDSFSEELVLRLDNFRLNVSHKKNGDKPSLFTVTGIINY